MTISNRTLAALIALLLTAFAPGCDNTAPAPAKTPAPEAAPPAASGKTEGGEHDDCYLIDIGDHLFLGDLECDAKTGTISVTILDHDEKKPYPHEGKEAMLNLLVGGTSRQFKMLPDPLKEDGKGYTSRYSVTHEDLKGVKELKGRLNIALNGETHICDLAKAH